MNIVHLKTEADAKAYFRRRWLDATADEYQGEDRPGPDQEDK